MKIIDKIELPQENNKKTKIRQIARNKPKPKKGIIKDADINSEVLKLIIDKFDDNETIMNLVAQVKSLNLEIGILKSEIAELEHIKINEKLLEKIKNQREAIIGLTNKINKFNNGI